MIWCLWNVNPNVVAAYHNSRYLAFKWSILRNEDYIWNNLLSSYDTVNYNTMLHITRPTIIYERLYFDDEISYFEEERLYSWAVVYSLWVFGGNEVLLGRHCSIY